MTAIFCVSGFISLIAWSQWTLRGINPYQPDMLHLEGTGSLRWTPAKAKLLQAISQMKRQTLITGRSSWAYCEAPSLIAFTGNRTYVTWSLICDQVLCGTTHGDTYRREREVNDFFDGKCANPLLFLRANDITAVAVWPDDLIQDDVLANLKEQLAPYYEYRDFRDDGPRNAGIFIYRAHLEGLPPAALAPPLQRPPPADVPAAKAPSPAQAMAPAPK